MRFIKFFIFCCLTIASFTISYAQNSAYLSKGSNFNKAQELFEKEKYGPAFELFFAIANNELNSSIEKSDAHYYAVRCAMELFHDDTEVIGERFVAQYPENKNVNFVYLGLGKYEYTKKKYKPAIEYFSKVNKDELEIDDKAEYYFKYGYSWFMLDSLDKARKAFYEIKDIDTRYTPSAIYYYSHIAYVQKNYETAISGFLKLKDDETFSPLVPYYISQCYYFQEKFDELLTYAPPLIDSVVDTRVGEMARLIADAYYRKAKYFDAIPYYERFFDKGKDIKNDDYFQAGYCYYTQKQYDKAIVSFEKASAGNNAISQNAAYLLGDCYIRLNQKDKALMAFSASAKADFDDKVKEDATFNYAVLSFELSNSPFNSSIKALNDYITKYPDSHRSDEAYNYLVTAMLNTKNYQEALVYLGKVKNKDKKIKTALQRALFFRGLELFNNLQFAEAKKMFEQSLRYAEIDLLLTARAYYWWGETAYRLSNVDEALDNYNLFTASSNAMQCDENKLVTYNIAYCFFNKKEYSNASSSFKKFVGSRNSRKDKLVADAYNRLGDCDFIESKYTDAIENYTKAIEIGLSNKDYAIFQKAFTLGLQGEHKKKISLLNTILTAMSESLYCDDAVYEIGRGNVSLQKTEEATKYFNKLIKDYPSSSYVKKALLQLGLIDYNAERNLPAIETYKKVVADYPATQEARSALTGIKNIYIEMNDVDSYLKYAETLGEFANVSVAEQDSLLYNSAENYYTAGDCKKALDNFTKYIEKFPEGSFALNAWYYKGECSNKIGKTDEAMEAFTKVIGKPRNNFSEMALAAAAKILIMKKDFQQALGYYQTLDSIAEIEQNISDARISQMQCFFELKQHTDAIDAAQKVLKMTVLPQETERKARYVLAKSYLVLNEPSKALESLKKLAADVKNAEGAEAKFLIADLYFKQTQVAKAEKEIFNFIELNTPHQYWMAKAFLLLADIYHGKKDDFQAISTLQSIIDNYDVKEDGIIKEAVAKKLIFEGKDVPVKTDEKPDEKTDPEEGL